jgi:predicted 3-demethylubiquinone-9 3-methyltransferase (glyoxalase superfamily)
VLCIDRPVKHAFGFSPAISLFVDCGSETEIVRLFTKLVEGGQILMPLDCYPFSNKYAWVSDQFGVSWQLNWSD